MDLEQLLGRYSRLKHELSNAYAEEEWQSARISRLADDLTLTERLIAAHRQRDQRSDESSSTSTG